MTDQWTNRLSEYIDGELAADEQRALEAHLATCGSCYATLAELRQVVARAKSLEDTAPVSNLWPAISDEIRRGVAISRPAVRPAVRRFSFSVPQLLAASIALVLLSGGGMWLGLHQRQSDTAIRDLTPAPTSGNVANVAWTGRTDAAIAELQAALTQNEKKLDTATVRIVRKNLAIIDRAIADARIALRNDPGNAYLNFHLAETMRRKVELLRRVNDMVAARS
jgi:anti-sigma factor RsiW